MKIYSYKKIRGVTLIDALIAMVVGSVGLLAMAIFHAELMTTSSESQARAEAVHLAQMKMERLRDIAVKSDIIKVTNNRYATADVVFNQSRTFTGLHSVFTIASVITGQTVGAIYNSSDAQFVKAKVTVSWTNSENIAKSVFVASLIAWDSPTAAAARGHVDHIDDLLSVGTFAAAPSGGGRMADPGETLFGNAYADNNDGTTIYYDGAGNYQIVADQLGDGAGLIPIFVSTEPILKLSGRISSSTANDLRILRVLTSDFGFCIYNEDGTTFSGSTGSTYDVSVTGSDDIAFDGDFNCYVAASWHGNVGVINKANEDFCSAAHRYVDNCEILDSVLYEDATGVGACPWSGSPVNGLIGELTDQNFDVNNGGCEISELPQPSVVGAVNITGNPKATAVEFSVDGGEFVACTITLQGQTVDAYKCVASENTTVVVKVWFGEGQSCTTAPIDVADTQFIWDINDRECSAPQ